MPVSCSSVGNVHDGYSSKILAQGEEKAGGLCGCVSVCACMGRLEGELALSPASPPNTRTPNHPASQHSVTWLAFSDDVTVPSADHS